MEIQHARIKELTPIQTFYDNAHIFITGATGFIGRLLIEKLLRTCPDNLRIYMLIRAKKGKSVETRLDELFEDVVFDEMKKVSPKFRHRIVVMEGDCALPGLGLSERDRELLIDKVNIVFHGAATVRFDEKLKLAVNINIKGVQSVIEIANQIKNLKSIIHISTAFSNCMESTIEEKIYPTACDVDKLINITDNLSDELIDDITPRLIGDCPNTYTFTKAIAENAFATGCKGLPAGIFRPSIIISTYKEPVAAWVNNIYGPMGISAAAGLGLMRVHFCDGKKVGNMVPADMSVNAVLAIAWEVGTKFDKNKENKAEDTPVYHYESSTDNPITWDAFMNLVQKYGMIYPSVKAIWYYSFRLIKNPYLFSLLFFLFQFVPAYIVDKVLFCIGKPPMMMKIVDKMYKMCILLGWFSTRIFKFQSERTRNLINIMSPKDRELFFCDLKELDWDVFFQLFIRGIRVYLMQDPMETLPEARAKWRRLKYVHNALKIIVAFVLFRIIWFFIMYFHRIMFS